MLPEQVVLNCVVPPMRVFSLALPANVPANTLLVLQRLVHLLVLDPGFLIEACNIAKERIIQRREMELQGLRFGRQPVASNQNPIPPAGSQIRPDGQYQHPTQPQMQPQVPSQNPNPLQQFLYDQQQEARLGPQGEAAFAQRLNNAQLQTQPQHQVQNPMSLPQNIRIPPPPLAPQPGYGATPAHVVPSATPAPHAQGPVAGPSNVAYAHATAAPRVEFNEYQSGIPGTAQPTYGISAQPVAGPSFSSSRPDVASMGSAVQKIARHLQTSTPGLSPSSNSPAGPSSGPHTPQIQAPVPSSKRPQSQLSLTQPTQIQVQPSVASEGSSEPSELDAFGTFEWNIPHDVDGSNLFDMWQEMNPDSNVVQSDL